MKRRRDDVEGMIRKLLYWYMKALIRNRVAVTIEWKGRNVCRRHFRVTGKNCWLNMNWIMMTMNERLPEGHCYHREKRQNWVWVKCLSISKGKTVSLFTGDIVVYLKHLKESMNAQS